MAERHTVLIVDDVEINRSILSDILCEDYSILEAGDGAQAVSLLRQRHGDISIVLLDLVMPVMDGFEVLAMMNKTGWIEDTPVITISAETSSGVIDHAYDLGASDYINRPFDEQTVRRRVRNTIMLYSKQRALEQAVAEQVMEKEQYSLTMVEILSNIVEFRNGESGLHVTRIRMLTEIFLQALMDLTDRYPLTPAQMAVIVNASALHDIGKISIPEEILNKPGRLTAEEFEIMKTHSAIGAHILEQAPYRTDSTLVETARQICRWHHERWDGGGYPDGLSGDDIPISAQVVALADVYDALTSQRVYKSAYSHDKAMEMILGGECGAFNPILTDCLRTVGPHLEEELKLRSVHGSDPQNRQLAAQLIANGKASSRTLALLEQERVKYQFFAAMSQEIQFDLDFKNDLLTFSDAGAKQLGLNPMILQPAQNPALCRIMDPADYMDLCGKLHRASPGSPLVSDAYRLTGNGGRRWFKVVARPMWLDGEQKPPTGAIGKFTDVHDERLRLEQLRQLADQDSLTGLNNQRAARQLIEGALAGGSGRYILLFFDLNGFHHANDRFGRLFGDQVLRHVAQQIPAWLGESGVAARVGGDDFLLFLPCPGDPEDLIRALMESLTHTYGDFSITVSLGAALSPDHGMDYDTLFRHADLALRSAKALGRAQYCLYPGAVPSPLAEPGR